MPINFTDVEAALRRVLPSGQIDGIDMVVPFKTICEFLAEFPEQLSWRGNKPTLNKLEDIEKLARAYTSGFAKSDFPAKPRTVPDEIVSIVMQAAYDYTEEACQTIKEYHQFSMCAENCVGALLERYIDSILRPHGWVWCCGSLVRAVDFIHKGSNGWNLLQIKNRDNSENSSSSAIRKDTPIQKWFRTYSLKRQTNWNNLPTLMTGHGLSEEGFVNFVKTYLEKKKPSDPVFIKQN